MNAILNRLRGPLFSIPGAFVVAFPPPAIQGLSTFAGFQFELLDQTGSASVDGLAGAMYGLMGQANQSGKVQGLFSSFSASDPQLVVDIDRDKARSLGLPLHEVTDALQVFLGSQYVNDFDFNNRAYRVYVQADQQFRTDPDRSSSSTPRTSNGQMVSLDNVVKVRETTAPRHQPLQPLPLGGNHGNSRGGNELGAGDRGDGGDGEQLPEGFSFAWSRAIPRGDQGRDRRRAPSSR